MYSFRVLFVYLLTIICVSTEEDSSLPMSKEERIKLREEARKMFYHAYDAYMDNAFPADELMPLSCKGRWRGVTPSRGDLDDVLGNYSLTLVDSLDSLVILGDFNEFNRAIKLVIENVRFDTDVVVSVFETNIRMLGGLLSAHVLASELRDCIPALKWYTNELLMMADDLGTRLLPAFNTSTGLPHGRVNLRRGMAGLSNNRETCTACAGTIILEFAALSRLTGKPIYEQKATRAMDRLWKTRHRTSELMGTTIDVHSGDWVRKDSGVGAGIDSYYEYCLKAYILLGDNKYLTRFNRHYNAIKKYISRGPLMLAVYMHRPHLQSRNFMDALLAFWPGLQVMMGDLRPAVETHEMLYQVMQRHTFIPEAFTSDFQVHWGQHPLRPEFLESTYFLHRATGDDHYLRVGKNILKSLQLYARVPCGYAAVNDVRTRVHEDRMDSFVLAETLKYLFMLFSEDSDLPVNIERFIMTTEAHFLPLSLGHSNSFNSSVRIVVLDEDEEDKTRRTCPNTSSLVPKKVREPMRQMVGSTAARPPARLRPLNDPRQILALADMGISVMTLDDGRVQLLYTTSTARSPNDAAEGLTFMNEMTKWNNLGDAENGVQLLGIMFKKMLYTAGPAHFGKEITGDNVYEGQLALVKPPDACTEIVNTIEVRGKFGIAYRGKCTFTQKVWQMQLAGVKLAIIIDNTANSTADTSAVFAMSNDGKEDVDVVIPSAFLYSKEGYALTEALKEDPDLKVTLAEKARLQKMLTCPGDECQENQMAAAERSSIDHLKTILTQLVAQFELSMNADEIPKKTHFKNTYPKIVYSKNKFGNDKNLGETSSGSTTVVKDNVEMEDPSAPEKDTESDLDSDDTSTEEVANTNVHQHKPGEEGLPCNDCFLLNYDGTSLKENESVDDELNVDPEKNDMINNEDYKNDRFNTEISQIEGIIEFTIEPETNENTPPSSAKKATSSEKNRKTDFLTKQCTPSYSFPPRRKDVCPIMDDGTGSVPLIIGTTDIPLQDPKNAVKENKDDQIVSDKKSEDNTQSNIEENEEMATPAMNEPAADTTSDESTNDE